MILYAYVLCLCILASSRIPRYDIEKQISAFSGGFYQKNMTYIPWFQNFGIDLLKEYNK
jgi:hypothetical protein